MKSTAILIISLLGFGLLAQAQEDESKIDRRPVKSPFEAGLLLENQTMVLNRANTLDFIIQHRFGKINSGEFDLIGLYAPSNIRIGLVYGVTDNINIGLGSTKNNKIQDVNWKWSVLKQTRSGSIPLSITYYGNVEFNMRKKENFGLEYQGSHRLSYLHELIVGRKFNSAFSMQVSASYSHFNQVDTTSGRQNQHDNISVALVGRYKVTPSLSAIFGYDLPLTAKDVKPGIGAGIEIGTSAHAFQVFLTTSDAISRQVNQTANQNDISNGDLLLGFNITRLWYF